ncbi:membrane protein [Thermoactinomyces vulgaris]|uniref:DUF4870 domain-containing protein n=1 Tax=Laceyella sediminis TaxID=573074 RepID=A0ABX5EJF5_9BACL|nr:DUF4870 domain-containing protein [Laceyella sediminis]KPC77173.1 membrane protein [Thermoactinomyces vulgaris]PRZ11767.1 hypothetical protein CLV36_1239 [Laceyella sediminis]
MHGKWLKVLVHASTWFAPVLCPIIVYLISSDRDVKRVSLQALVFHVIMAGLIWLSSLLSWLLIGIPFLIVFGLMAFICPIKGILRALNEKEYHYPFTRWAIK